MIHLTIDGKVIETEAGKTVLEAALDSGLYIPNLCYHPDLKPTGACRLCVVEIEGQKGLPTSCTMAAQEGMIVKTNTERLQEYRQNLIWMLLSEYPDQPEAATQFRKIIDYIGKKQLLSDYEPRIRELHAIENEPLYIRDMDKCILCGRCVQICRDVREVGVLGFVGRGINASIGTSFNVPMEDAACRFCGACIEVCPTGALRDKDPCGENITPEERDAHIVPCRGTCPAGIDIPRYVSLIARGRYQDALEVIREKVPFPGTLGLVCDHPCEGVCKGGQYHKPLSIRALKRFVAERDTGRWREKVQVAPDSGKHVAIIGSGPAGLTAAWFLRKKGHKVSVYEALPELGGMLRVGIPEYRLVNEVLDQEIKDILSIGVEVKRNTCIESLDTLFEQGIDAVFIAIGAHAGMSLGMPGEENPRVLDGISVLRSIRLGEPVDLSGRVAVVGGGNVAMDVARSALRKDASAVTILYRRTREEMPAYEEEIEAAIEEGVQMRYLVNPARVLPQENSLAVECIQMELGEPDESGRRRPVPIEGSEFLLEVDWLIAAIGQKTPLPEGFGIVLNRRGRIEVDIETGQCARERVYSGGDVETGPASVIFAIQGGRRAASAIDEMLGGDGSIDEKYIPEEKDDPHLGRDETFKDRDRPEQPTRPVAERLKGFDEVEFGLDESTAVEEASRCLRCHLRLEIARPPLPPGR